MNYLLQLAVVILLCLFVAVDCLFTLSPLSYFEIVFSVVYRFSANIVLNCAVTGGGLVFGIGVEMLIEPVISECRGQKKDLQVIGLSISAEVWHYH
jgi:hypothetical protein